MFSMHRTLCLSACLLLGNASWAQASPHLAEAWAGHYPSEALKPGAGGLFEQAAIKAPLARLLSKADRATLSQLSVETPVKRIDDFIVVDKCRPHNCGADMATVVIDPRSGHVWVNFFVREAQRVVTRWYGEEDDESALPDSVRQHVQGRR
jgi:hypothetical protein